MSTKRTRTKTKGGKKIQCNFEYGLDSIDFYISYRGGVVIRYENNDGLSRYEVSEKLLKLFYELVEMDIPKIQRLLKVKITDEGIFDKEGKDIRIVLL